MSFSIEPVRQPTGPVLNGATPNTPPAASNPALAQSETLRPAVVYQPAPPQGTEPATYTVPRAAQPVSATSETRFETTAQSDLRTFTPPLERDRLAGEGER